MMTMGIDAVIEDGAWARGVDGPLLYGQVERVGIYPATGEQPKFQVLARLDDGSHVVVETTWALMKIALKALDASPQAP